VERKFSALFVIVAGAFVATLLVANVVAGRLVSVAGLALPGGVVVFPLTYLFGDVLTEVYGFRRSRLVIWTGFAANLMAVLVYAAVTALPAPAFWHGAAAYDAVLGVTPRVGASSMLAYFAGEFANSAVLSKMKLLTGGRWLWTRTIGSTAVGEGIDTLIFITGTFLGSVPASVLGQMIAAQYAWKVLYETAATPLTYAVVGWLKRVEGVDAFDHGVRYTPFSLEVD
jgi:uncharacterized integral membrane protein (TIGR00697 family)